MAHYVADTATLSPENPPPSGTSPVLFAMIRDHTSYVPAMPTAA
jgi:hypothetical protein